MLPRTFDLPKSLDEMDEDEFQSLLMQELFNSPEEEVTDTKNDEPHPREIQVEFNNLNDNLRLDFKTRIVKRMLQPHSWYQTLDGEYFANAITTNMIPRYSKKITAAIAKIKGTALVCLYKEVNVYIFLIPADDFLDENILQILKPRNIFNAKEECEEIYDAEGQLIDQGKVEVDIFIDSFFQQHTENTSQPGAPVIEQANVVTPEKGIKRKRMKRPPKDKDTHAKINFLMDQIHPSTHSSFSQAGNEKDLTNNLINVWQAQRSTIGAFFQPQPSISSVPASHFQDAISQFEDEKIRETLNNIFRDKETKKQKR